MPPFTFISNTGDPVTVHSEQIRQVSRPKGTYGGALRLSTGAQWEFGGDKAVEYKRAKKAMEIAQIIRQEEAKES